MLASFDKLNKILNQEKKLGYKNKVIFGGLEKFVPNWANDAMAEATSPEERDLIEEIAQELVEYATISEDDRPNYLHQILVKLYRAEEGVKEAAATRQKPNRAANQSPAQPTETSANESANHKLPVPLSEVSEARADSEKPAPHHNNAGGNQSTSEKSAKPNAESASRPAPSRPDLVNTGLDSAVTKLPGIKAAMAKKLANLNVFSVGDFLKLYPRRYDDYRALKTINQLEYGEEVTIIAQVWETRKRDLRNNRTIITTILSDGTATIEVSWFNQPWLVNKLSPGTQIVVSGRVNEYLGHLTFQSPEWEELDKESIHTGRIVPVYPLTQGITGKWLRKQVKSTVDYWSYRLPDYLPTESRERLDMLQLEDAVRQIHFPDDWEMLEAARRRLAFDELLMIQLGVFNQRQKWQEQQGQPLTIRPETIEAFLGALPFQLTFAQRRALDEIIIDLKRDVPMSRLLQGDVGSGKTVVALAALVFTVLDGGQGAILAPTEILAEQHHKGMTALLDAVGDAMGRPFNLQLLTGSISAADRTALLADLAGGQVDILVGTHAIIQEDVALNNLRLAVIDEQHRFGVEQRSALREKGFNPHMLVMTATPIPRTLALTLYGDLDLSIIDEMPPGRRPIQTRWLGPTERERAYSFIRSQIEKGRQAYIICPLVEESDNTEAKSAVEEHKRLSKQIFPRLQLGLLHGRMKSGDKEAAMKAFRDREVDILVSTSVVEVGIDVPNSTVMLVEGANRFGLAQLHQFRGRVGRGEHQSYCLLLADKVTDEAKLRLKAVESTSNGFDLAEEDLKMRGPGEFFGTRQSGLPDLKLVKLSDTRLLELARREAQLIFEQDPTLEQPQHRLLAKELADFWRKQTDLS